MQWWWRAFGGVVVILTIALIAAATLRNGVPPLGPSQPATGQDIGAETRSDAAVDKRRSDELPERRATAKRLPETESETAPTQDQSVEQLELEQLKQLVDDLDDLLLEADNCTALAALSQEEVHAVSAEAHAAIADRNASSVRIQIVVVGAFYDGMLDTMDGADCSIARNDDQVGPD